MLRSLLAEEPENLHAICLMAQAELMQGHHEASLQWSRQAIANAPDSEWGYRLASIALRRLGRLDDAVAMGRVAVELAADSAANLRVLAQALSANGAQSEAQSVAERAAALAPNDAESHLLLGVIAAADQRYDQAMHAFRRCLSIQPDNSAAHNELARLQLKRRRVVSSARLARAADGFATSLRHDPSAETSRRNLDLVLQVFLARTAYAIFVAAYLGSRSDGSGQLRALPAIALILLLIYAARFVTRLNLTLRRYLRQLLRGPMLRTAVACDAVAVLAIIYAATALPGTSIAFIVAVVTALTARIVLAVRRARTFPRGDARRNILGTGVLWFIAITLWVMAAFLLVVSRGTGTNTAAAVLAALVCGLGGAGLAWTASRRKKQL